MFEHSFEWWLRWVEFKLGADSHWDLLTIVVMVPTCLWLYFVTCWNNVFDFRIERHMNQLRNNAPWPHRWWHHPREGYVVPLFGHWFYTAMLFEVWFHVTVWHGRRLPQQPDVAVENYEPPSFKSLPKRPSPQLEFDFAATEK